MKDKVVEVYGDMMGIDMYPLFDSFLEFDSTLECVAYDTFEDGFELNFGKLLDNTVKKFIYDTIPYVVKIELDKYKVIVTIDSDIWAIYKIGDRFFNI